MAEPGVPRTLALRAEETNGVSLSGDIRPIIPYMVLRTVEFSREFRSLDFFRPSGRPVIGRQLGKSYNRVGGDPLQRITQVRERIDSM
jgi:hypothetical protein